MRFAPKTEAEILEEGSLKAGVYDFEVMEADERKSKSGNDMIEIKIRVFSDSGDRFLFDYLLENIAFKLRHFCDSVGLLTSYENGTLSAAQCVGKAGKVKLGIRKDGDFAGKNEVKDYIKRENFEKTAVDSYKAAFDSPPLQDDNIPF